MRSIRRRQSVAAPDRAPGEPLIEGPTALRAWRDSDLRLARGRLPGPRDLALDPGPVPLRTVRRPQLPAPAPRRAPRRRLGAVRGRRRRRPRPPARVDLADALLVEERARPRSATGWPRTRAARATLTRAVRLITDWGFVHLGLHRIDLVAATGNPASQRVAERCGFTREAVLRSYMVEQGRPRRHGRVRPARHRPPRLNRFSVS